MSRVPPSTKITLTREDGYCLSTDPTLIDIPRVHNWLSTDCYWAIGRPLKTVQGAFENSLGIGVYVSVPFESQTAGEKRKEQIACARVVTDYCLAPRLSLLISSRYFRLDM